MNTKNTKCKIKITKCTKYNVANHTQLVTIAMHDQKNYQTHKTNRVIINQIMQQKKGWVVKITRLGDE